MPPEKLLNSHCPNCGAEGIREGNKITCYVCDATFTIQKTGGAKVKTLGRLETLEAQVSELFERTAPTAAPPAEPADPAEPPSEEEPIL